MRKSKKKNAKLPPEPEPIYVTCTKTSSDLLITLKKEKKKRRKNHPSSSHINHVCQMFAL